MADLTNLGIGGGGGILGVVLGWFGCKSKIDSLSKNVRYKDTCNAVHVALEKRLDGIEKMQTEMRDDIKKLLPGGK